MVEPGMLDKSFYDVSRLPRRVDNGSCTLVGAALFNYTSVTPGMYGAPCSAYVYFGIEYAGECRFYHIVFLPLMTDEAKYATVATSSPQQSRLLDALSRKRC
jgi:hypothetical protein